MANVKNKKKTIGGKSKIFEDSTLNRKVIDKLSKEFGFKQETIVQLANKYYYKIAEIVNNTKSWEEKKYINLIRFGSFVPQSKKIFDSALMQYAKSKNKAIQKLKEKNKI